MAANLELMTMKDLENEMMASNLFSLDKEASFSLYQKEKYRMLELVFEYGRRMWDWENKTKNQAEETYSIELWNLAERCFKNFKPEKGSFVDYLKGALRLEKQWMDSKSQAEKQRFVDVERMIDGEESISLLDLLPLDTDLEKSFVETENLMLLFRQINEAYLEAREASRPVLAALLTNDVAESVREPELLKKLEAYEFFDTVFMAEIYKRGAGFRQKEIGARFGKSAANISSIYARFKEQLRHRMDEGESDRSFGFGKGSDKKN